MKTLGQRTHTLLAVPVCGKQQRLDTVRAPTVVEEGTLVECMERAALLGGSKVDHTLITAFVNGLRVFQTDDWVYYLV